MSDDSCQHQEFASEVCIATITEDDDSGKIIGYVAEIVVYCVKCGKRLKFIGLPTGLSLIGPSVSVTGTEARLAAIFANK